LPIVNCRLWIADWLVTDKEMKYYLMDRGLKEDRISFFTEQAVQEPLQL
jgi:hypothetical protein